MTLPRARTVFASLLTCALLGGTSNMDIRSPVSLRLEFSKTLSLHAVLLNHSPKTVVFLHDEQRQPSRLILIDFRGKELVPEDARHARKFNAAVERDMYKEVAAGQSVTLYENGFFFESGAYGIHWGPYQFHGIPHGAYHARVEMRSERDDYVDETGKQHRMNNVWKGTVLSSPLALELPPR